MMSNWMLPYFPTACKGETVFSVLSRFAKRLRHNASKILHSLTGRLLQYHRFGGFPSRLERIAERVPTGNPWSNAWYILENHTGLSYATYFFDKSLKERLKTEFSPRRLGISQLRLQPWPTNPRFCIKCLEEQKEHGFTYFIREHQLPGVLVCYRHHVPLSIGCRTCGPYPFRKAAIFLPGECNCKLEIDPLNLEINPNLKYDHLIWIAEQSSYLVNSKEGFQGELYSAIKMMLTDNGVMRGGLVNRRKLAKDITVRFGENFLHEFHCRIYRGGHISPWLRCLIRPALRKPAFTQMVLIGTYFESITSFEETIKRPADRIESRQPNTSMEIRRRFKQNTKRLQKPMDKKGNEIDPVRLHALSNGGAISLRSLAYKLNATPWQTARACLENYIRIPLRNGAIYKLTDEKIQAIGNDLRNGMYKTQICLKYGIHEESLLAIIVDQPSLDQENATAIRARIIRKHRQTVMGLIESGTCTTRGMLFPKYVHEYDYLKNYDNEWLDETLPPFLQRRRPNPENKPGRRRPRINWASVDEEAARQVRSYIKKNKESDLKPVWLSKTACLIMAGCQHRYNTKRFPELTMILNQDLESRDEFRKRRIKWAMREIIKDGNGFGMFKLKHKSCLSEIVLRQYMEFTVAEAESLGIKFSCRSAFAAYKAMVAKLNVGEKNSAD